MTEVNRHNIRKIAFQTLFMIYSNHIDDSQDAIERVWALTQRLKTDEEIVIPDYLIYLVDGVLNQQSDIDAKIQASLKTGWSLPRLNRSDLIILRLGVFEIIFETELPKKVAINEAIELAKEFGDDTSRAFINGVLSKFVHEEVDKNE
ncbi:transcription antitermination factor NusB [Agrilactobacillus fermenti]|uniref:transcription antitermination factor NusB n=1 Tax=Agrilactobacillus fermenti TaxID=2586909 RepID=UPI001E58F8DC|nr:transcription antitermination factor NusB [Agrilactobacillus fermenti]MCD2256206.1 transcription antitermination factor NusB [Agrilactobacillus fermenti]